MPSVEPTGTGPEDSDFDLRDCPLCGLGNHERSALQFSQPPWLIKQCCGCGFVYLENTLPYERLVAGDHAWTESKVTERRRRREEEPIYDRVSLSWRKLRRRIAPRREKSIALIRALIPTGTLLDVGCGGTGILRYTVPGLSVSGIEIDKAAAGQADRIARDQGGRVVHADAINGFARFDRNMFDGVLMRSYLEHEVDPRAALVGAAGVIRPGGCVIIKVPNYASLNRRLRGRRWCGFRFPDHVNYFEPDTLQQMVRTCGLEIGRFGFADRLPSSDNMWMVARKSAESARRAA